MKVTTSCLSRFTIFDQAQQLYRLGLLNYLISGYPKYYMEKWGIPRKKAISLSHYGVANRAAHSINRLGLSSSVYGALHNMFSRKLARIIPQDSDILIGLSSFCLEAIEVAKKRGILTVVDHGSLHIRDEREVLMKDCMKYGFRHYGSWSREWLIHKEDQEFASADFIFVLSNIAKKSFIKYGIPEDKIFVNSCGVDLRNFSPSKKSDTKFRIIQCSTIIPRKGIHYLLQAFSELKLPNSELWFIGGGLKEAMRDKSFASIINRYAGSNVHFLGTFPQNRLRELYGQGSIFVLPSLSDGFGLVVPQAMACRLPVIVTSTVGAADLVIDGENGFIIQPGDIDTLKEKITILYENEHLAMEMGVRALAAVRGQFTWDHYGDRLKNILYEIYPHGK